MPAGKHLRRHPPRRRPEKALQNGIRHETVGQHNMRIRKELGSIADSCNEAPRFTHGLSSRPRRPARRGDLISLARRRPLLGGLLLATTSKNPSSRGKLAPPAARNCALSTLSDTPHCCQESQNQQELNVITAAPVTAASIISRSLGDAPSSPSPTQHPSAARKPTQLRMSA
jgi:hypothetical protein